MSHPSSTHMKASPTFLRTNEYRDRNPQYQWMLTALNLRKVHIWDFSRVNFVYTFLSKRKLRDCLELGLARGWDDPRFPTFRGMRRRGMTVEALKAFMLSQGPSQNQVLLEWDSIWTINKKIIDPVAPRFTAIATQGMYVGGFSSSFPSFFSLLSVLFFWYLFLMMVDTHIGLRYTLKEDLLSRK